MEQHKDESLSSVMPAFKEGLTAYSHKHDAYYNAGTGEWLEKQCSDKKCGFCKDRPAVAIEQIDGLAVTKHERSPGS